MRVQLFDGQGGRTELVDHANYAIVNCLETVGHVGSGTASGGLDHSGFKQFRTAAAGFYDRVAGRVQAGVDAEDARGVHAAIPANCGWKTTTSRWAGFTPS